MYKSASSSNGLSGCWSGEEEMKQQEMVIKARSKQNSFMQLPDCPVCWDGFDDGPRMPRLLHCGHTICQICLEHLLFESGPGQRRVRCPECRGVCVWRGLHELPKNYILLPILSSSSSTHKHTKFGSEFTPRPLILPQLPIISQISRLSSHIIEHIPRIIKRKLWDLGKLSWALIAMVVLLPLSFVHMVLAWSIAIFGSFVFVWFSLGSVGIMLFMLSTWLCYTIAQLVVELGLRHFSNQIRYRPPRSLVRPYT